MFAKKVSYEDFDGNIKEEVFRFHLMKSEVMEWLLSPGDGATLDQRMVQIFEKNSTSELMEAFTDLIDRSYGEKTIDGRFEKSPEILAKFKSKEAYSIIFMEIFSDADKTLEFLKGILPKDFSEGLDEAIAKGGGR